jgi:hypothetical protein
LPAVKEKNPANIRRCRLRLKDILPESVDPEKKACNGFLRDAVTAERESSFPT